MPTPSVLIVPNRYKAAKLYSQIPDSGAVDFDVTRATTAYRTNASGLLESVASGVPRLDYTGGGCPSLLVEPAATNLALQSRDLTNIVWIKVNATASKTAIGADGVASGATTLTASGASGTVLQTIVSASSSRIFSAYVRRRTGTGTVQITQDNGTTWTAITLTASYQRFSSPTGTITNPVFGFRILTSGDEIDVDFTQQETGAVATSAIPTVAATATRNADVISKTGVSGFIGQTEGTIYAEVDLINWGTNLRLLSISDGSVNNHITLTKGASANTLRIISRLSNVLQVSIQSSALTGNIFKVAAAYANNDFVLYVNGVQIGTNTSAGVPLCSNVILGSSEAGTGTSVLNDRIRAAAVYTTRLSNSELATLTTL
jgi:hypothetical protein